MPISRVKVVTLITLLLLVIVQVQAVQPGRLTVFSSVAGAYACVDTTECDLTPADFWVSGNDWHTVVVTEKGYVTWSGPVYVTTEQTSLVNADMQLDPSTIGFQVSATPGSGTVCLDTTECHPHVGTSGSTGTTRFTGVSEGYHTITVRNTAGYLDYSTTGYVTPGKITTIAINLSPVTGPSLPTGSVLVTVNLAGSSVCIDTSTCNQSTGGADGSPATAFFTGITAGAGHAVTVSADGYIPYSSQVTVSPGQVSEVDVSLLPVAPSFTPAPTPLPTQSGTGPFPLLGALAFCSAVALFRQGRP